MAQETKLPDGVPELPPERFYRISKVWAGSNPMLRVQIRERRRVGSRMLARVHVSPEIYTRAADAVTMACVMAYAQVEAMDRKRRGADDCFAWVGDWEGVDR